jgi:SAM-dependent methyltransferase
VSSKSKKNKVSTRKGSAAEPLKIDIGCGKNKREGFKGLDRREFPGVDIVHDVTKYPWPFKTSSVDEVHCSHFLEHLDHNSNNPARVRFMNELYRVLKPGGKATIITPHWCSNRAYGDFTHADKPVSEMFYYYLSKEWRSTQAPDNDIEWNPLGYSCDFTQTCVYSVNPALNGRPNEYVQDKLNWAKEAAMDIIATLTSNKKT